MRLLTSSRLCKLLCHDGYNAKSWALTAYTLLLLSNHSQVAQWAVCRAGRAALVLAIDH